jgi:hypothetical protein
MCHQLQKWSPGRVANAQFIIYGYKLAAIPKAGCRLYGRPIYIARNKKNKPARYIIEPGIFLLIYVREAFGHGVSAYLQDERRK